MRVNKLEIIQTVIKTLNNSQIPKSNLSSVLEILSEKMPILRSVLMIHQAETDKLVPIAVNNLNAAEFRRLETRAEKSILRKVFEIGETLIISPLSNEKSLNFLEKTETETSLIILPILLEEQNLGLFAAEFELLDFFETESYKIFLSVIASLIAQTFKIEKAVAEERRKIAAETSHLRQELKQKYDFSNIIGNSAQMRQINDQIAQISRTNVTVLLRGDSGTGKEMIANAVHYNSLRSKKPFIKINCAALPENLIESEIFGFKNRKKSALERADGGTLFLDEISDLPMQTQAKLLRVLQEKEFERLGGTESLNANVRLIAATHKNLEKEIECGKFREDLFYQLSVFTIFLPPLRERKSDILLLAEHFLAKYEREHNKEIKRISTPAIDMLTQYHFPGNIRELENVIEHAVLVCDEQVIYGHHLPPTLQTAEISGTETQISLENAIETFESDLIQDALKSTRGNIAKAARLLDSTERILGYKIKKYDIDVRRFR